MSYHPRDNIDVAAGSKGAEGTLVFEWNKADLTQFDGTGAQFIAGGAAGTLSVVAVTDRGNAIRYTRTGGVTSTEIFLVTAPIVFPDTRRDLLIEMELADMGASAGGYAGIAWCCDDSAANFHGYMQMGHGAAEWQTCINNGAVERGGNTGSNAGNRGGWSRTHIRGDKPAGAAPRVSGFPSARDAAGSRVGRGRRSGSSVVVRGGVSQLGNNSVLGATWNTLNLDRFGIGVQSSGGNPPPATFDVLDFRVYLVNP